MVEGGRPGCRLGVSSCLPVGVVEDPEAFAFFVAVAGLGLEPVLDRSPDRPLAVAWLVLEAVLCTLSVSDGSLSSDNSLYVFDVSMLVSMWESVKGGYVVFVRGN